MKHPVWYNPYGSKYLLRKSLGYFPSGNDSYSLLLKPWPSRNFVSFPMNMAIFHSYVNVYQTVSWFICPRTKVICDISIVYPPTDIHR